MNMRGVGIVLAMLTLSASSHAGLPEERRSQEAAKLLIRAAETGDSKMVLAILRSPEALKTAPDAAYPILARGAQSSVAWVRMVALRAMALLPTPNPVLEDILRTALRSAIQASGGPSPDEREIQKLARAQMSRLGSGAGENAGERKIQARAGAQELIRLAREGAKMAVDSFLYDDRRMALAPGEAARVLMAGLNDRDVLVQAVSLRALGQIELPDVPGLVPSLRPFVKAEDRNARWLAVKILARQGKPAVPVLTEALEDSDGEIRTEAAFGLARAGFSVGAGEESRNSAAGSLASHALRVLANQARSVTEPIRDDLARELSALGRPRDEFETSSEYQKRVTNAPLRRKELEATYGRKIQEASAEMEATIRQVLQMRFWRWADVGLGRYDADSERFPAEVGVHDTVMVWLRVPRAEAPRVKAEGVKAKQWYRVTRDGGRQVVGGVVEHEALGRLGSWGETAPPAAGSPAVASAKPSRLVLEATLVDANGDGVLEAEETGRLRVSVRNTGGPADEVGVSLGLSGIGVAADASVQLGAIGSQETRAGETVLTASPDVRDATMTVTLIARDRRGFESPPMMVRFRTAAVRPPDVQIANLRVDDDDQGLSLGNANGVVDAGEQVELRVRLENRGRGPTRDTRVALGSGHPDIRIVGDSEKSVGSLAPGQAADYVGVFQITKPYHGPDPLPLKLVIRDARPRWSVERPLGLRVGETVTSARLVEMSGVAQTALVAVDVPPAFGPPPGGRWDHAVVIGIEKYRDLPPATYAARDAEVFREYLARAFGTPEANLQMLVNERASRTDLVRFLEGWLERRVKPGERVIVYFSGHGTPEPTTGEQYLMPYDGTAGELQATGYPLRRLYEKLRALPCREAMVVLDACFSGVGSRGATGQMLLAKGIRPLALVAETPVGTDGKVVVVSAARGVQISGSLAPARHGLFTYYLLRGLGGAADADKDGRVSLAELMTYVRPEVEGVARREDGRDQTPDIQPPLALLGAKARQPLVTLR